MRTIICNDGVIDLATPFFEDYVRVIQKNGLTPQLSSLEEVALFFLESDITDLLQVVNSSRFGPSTSVRSLAAHGKSCPDGYWYEDAKGTLFPITEWINEHDGSYDILLIYPCNTGRVTIYSRQSMLVYSNQTFDSLYIRDARRGKQTPLVFQHPQKQSLLYNANKTS